MSAAPSAAPSAPPVPPCPGWLRARFPDLTPEGWEQVNAEVFADLGLHDLDTAVDRLEAEFAGWVAERQEDALFQRRAEEAERRAGAMLRQAGVAPASPDPGAVPLLRTRAIRDVQPEEINWLWPRWLARGKVSLLVGPPGSMKSTALLDLAVRCATGRAFPGGAAAPPARWLFLSTEDAAGDVLRPRWEQLGGPADSDALHVLDVGADFLDLTAEDGRARLAGTARAVGATVVVLDPLSGFMQGVRSDVEDGVRPFVTALGQLAERHGLAVVGIRHTRKRGNNPSAEPLDSVLGSTAWAAVVRSVLMVAPHPEEEDTSLFQVVKSNIARRPDPLQFRRDEDGPLEWAAGTMTVEAALAARPERDAGPSRAEEGADWLRQFLRAGMRPATETETAARDAGFTGSTYRRARGVAGVQAHRIGGRWFLALPTGTPAQDDQEDQDDQDDHV